MEPYNLPIEALAHRTGYSVRNIRELQTRGLLDPPRLAGRRGFYGEGHLTRLSLIKRLQDRGYSLAAIRDLIARWREGTQLEAVIGLERAVTPPAAREGRALDEAGIRAVLPQLVEDAALRERAEALGVIARDGEGRLFAPEAELIETAALYVDGGAPLSAVLDGLEALRGDMERIAARFRAFFDTWVFAPLQRDGLPPESVAKLTELVPLWRERTLRAAQLVLAQAVARGAPSEE